MELKITGLTKTYGDVVALDGIDMTFTPGVYGLLGANGAGKSTTINLITDSIKREHGSITCDGTDILKLGSRFREKLGYMPQSQCVYGDFSPRIFLRYVAELKGIRKNRDKIIDELLEVVNLTDVQYKKIGGFSGGMRQRVLLAQALMGEPEILILDEPTTGLDPKERINFREYIKNLSRDKIIIVATHVVPDVESIAKEIIIMRKGRIIIHDTPKQLITNVSKELKEEDINLEQAYLYYINK